MEIARTSLLAVAFSLVVMLAVCWEEIEQLRHPGEAPVPHSGAVGYETAVHIIDESVHNTHRTAQVVERHLDDIGRCYGVPLETRQGVLSLSWTIGTYGRVRNPRIDWTGSMQDSTVACLRELMGEWRFHRRRKPTQEHFRLVVEAHPKEVSVCGIDDF